MKITYRAVSKQGSREEMEDRYHISYPFRRNRDEFLAGIFDGHFSSFGAKLAAENFTPYFSEALKNGVELGETKAVTAALEQSFKKISDEIKDLQGNSGTCALVLYISSSNRAFVGHVGDNRLVAASNGQYKTMTHDHRLSNPKEEKRIRKCGGLVLGKHVYNTSDDGLMVLRSLGDKNFESVGVIDTPECRSMVLPTNITTTFLMGTDGLFDFVPRKCIRRVMLDPGTIDEKRARLKQLVMDTGAPDNFTFILVSVE